MVKCLCSFVLSSALILWGAAAYPQITTINYATSGLSKTATDVFASNTLVGGYNHLTIIQDNNYEAGMNPPQFNGTSIILQASMYGTDGYPKANVYFCGEGYSIAYPFSTGYYYTISLNVTPIAASGWTAKSPLIGLGVNWLAPTYTSNISYTGFESTIAAYYAAELTVLGPSGWEVPNQYCDIPFLNSPVYDAYFTNTNNTTVTLPTFNVVSASSGINIESIGSPELLTGIPAIAINSVTITALPFITPSSTSVVCGSQTYTCSSSVPVTWSVSPSNLASIAPSGNSVTLTTTGNGVVTLTATASSGGTTFENINVGAPGAPGIDITGIEPLQAGTEMDVTVSTPAPPPYLWYVNGTLVGTEYSASATINGGDNCNTLNTLKVAVSNACGTTDGSTQYTRPCTESNAVSAFQVSPNPAHTSVTISAPAAAPMTSDAAAGSPSTATSLAKVRPVNQTPRIYGVMITDISGHVISHQRYSSGLSSTQVSLSGIVPGVYIITVFDGKTWKAQKLLVQ